MSSTAWIVIAALFLLEVLWVQRKHRKHMAECEPESMPTGHSAKARAKAA